MGGGRILNPNEAAMLPAEMSALRSKMSDKQLADAPLYGGTDTYSYMRGASPAALYYVGG